MPYSETIALRIRLSLAGHAVTEKRMMGGLCFMVQGHMCVGLDQKDSADRLMVRVGSTAHEAALRLKHAIPMDFTGRPMKGFVFVAAAGISSQRALTVWVKRGLAFVQSLPPK